MDPPEVPVDAVAVLSAAGLGSVALAPVPLAGPAPWVTADPSRLNADTPEVSPFGGLRRNDCPNGVESTSGPARIWSSKSRSMRSPMRAVVIARPVFAR